LTDAVEHLDLYLRDEHIAQLHEGGFGYAALTYDAEVVERYGAGAVVLSIGLPIRAETYPGVDTRAFLDGLLPEGDTREVISRNLHLDKSDVFGLLRELGLDVAGAVVITREDAGVPERAPSVRWLSPIELEEEIENLPYVPLGVEAEGDVRLSLAGVQPKLGIVRDGDQIGLPVDGYPTTHILKPPSTRLDDGGNALFPDVVANEAFCMRLATRAGLGAAAITTHVAAGRTSLIIERFDRETLDGVVHRIHQEDACQALRIMPERKYEEHGGPSLRQIAALLGDYSAAPVLDRFGLLDYSLFHVLVGNTDAHGKNVSFIYRDGGVRLSPLYDVVGTAVYPRHSQRLAMTIGGEIMIDDVDMEAFERAYEECGLSAALARRRIPETAEKIVAALAPTLDEASAEGWRRPIADEIANRVSDVAQRIA